MTLWPQSSLLHTSRADSSFMSYMLMKKEIACVHHNYLFFLFKVNLFDLPIVQFALLLFCLFLLSFFCFIWLLFLNFYMTVTTCNMHLHSITSSITPRSNKKNLKYEYGKIFKHPKKYISTRYVQANVI